MAETRRYELTIIRAHLLRGCPGGVGQDDVETAARVVTQRAGP